MAASMLPSQRKEDFKDQFLTCSLCFEPYDNGEHQAKYLPCIHSYCKSCLRKHAGRRPRFNCPKCRFVVQLADGNIDSLPNDFIVENLKEYQDVFNLAVTCGSCDEGDQSVSFCHDCGCFLCERCVNNHHKMRALRDHKLTTTQELQEKKCNPKMQHRCKKHPTMPLNLYCKNADCKVSVCASCGLVDHRGHDLVDLRAAIDEIVADMRQSSTAVATRNQELTRKRATVDTMQKTLAKNLQKTEKAMQESVKKLHSLIDSHYDKAHSNLIQLYQAEKNRLTERNESIDLLATQMTSACEFANRACDTIQSAQLLTSQNQIMERLDELQNAALPSTESNKTDFVLTAKHHSAIEQMEGPLKNMCDVDWLIQQPNQIYGGRGGKKQPKSTSSRPMPKPRYSEVDPSQCTIQLRRTSELYARATVQIVAFNGQLITTGGVKIEATQGRRVLGVQDNKDGTYTTQYYIYGGSLHVNINGTPMKGSPFPLR